jgi:hypothetical protein
MAMADRFDWDERKDAENRRKHGVLTDEFMKKRIRYSDEPIGPVEIVPDFLPPPEELAREDDGVKVTLALSRRSVDFFKAEAQRQNCSYQRMIRRLVDSYAARYSAGSRSGR